MKTGLERAVKAGEIDPVSIELTAGILNAALAEACGNEHWQVVEWLEFFIEQ